MAGAGRSQADERPRKHRPDGTVPGTAAVGGHVGRLPPISGVGGPDDPAVVSTRTAAGRGTSPATVKCTCAANA